MLKNFSQIALGFLIAVIMLGPISAEKYDNCDFPYPIYLNGKEIKLKEILLSKNRTYIGLREFCNKAGMTVEWRDPNHHYVLIPGGNLPSGINIMNPSFVYVKEVVEFDNTNNKVLCVDITGIYHKYVENGSFKYYFNDRGLVIEGEQKRVIELKYNPSGEHVFVSVDEFREKIQPYFVDICMQ